MYTIAVARAQRRIVLAPSEIFGCPTSELQYKRCVLQYKRGWTEPRRIEIPTLDFSNSIVVNVGKSIYKIEQGNMQVTLITNIKNQANMQISLLDVCSGDRKLFAITLSFVRGMGSIWATGGILDGKASDTVMVFDLLLKRWQRTYQDLNKPRH